MEDSGSSGISDKDLLNLVNVILVPVAGEVYDSSDQLNGVKQLYFVINKV